ncbi:hypothetical protein VA596_44655 [Amycolatopsis sp., V23-08]|uniref:DUF5666 domain-containing protein n=1 Tax=Amycolatopsis heterodermiae TaxID=3110235 RepID=A0ABU5RK79_9PSEU|nr:hypothetical protein [Amycolatopsis sp., V23-08]MEA5366688.1 hypothetical protein [Amycolatopsis sp., V23-08]
MTTPQAPQQTPSTSDPAWGAAPEAGWGGAPAPAPGKPGWPTGKKVAAGAVAAVIVAGGGAAIWAASSSSATTDTAAGPGGAAGGMRGGPGGAGALGSALHGEYVSSDGNGGYVTKIMQTGKVTALSATSLTAQSDDGFSKTYTITSAQATGVASGDTVTVVATESGDAATATSVTEGTTGAGQGQQGQPPAGAPAQTG